MIPDVEERSHERYVGSLVVKQQGYNKNYRQFQRYPKFVENQKNADNQRYLSRTSCWSGYPLISFNSTRREEQPRQFYQNAVNPLKYANGKAKCSYSELVTDKQGAPLIQQNKFQEKNWDQRFRGKNYHGGEAKTPNDAGRKSECQPGDENFANVENCLPRIIKPRKRRKKDRKPNTFVSASGQQTQNVKKSQDKDKPYKIQVAEKPDSQLLNVHLSLYRPKSKPLNLYQEGSSDLLISRSLVNLFAEDGSQLFGEDLRFDNLKESTDSQLSTFCNCRYCDPEGVVWDIRQRCFSPNLMPPVSGSNKLAKNKDWSTTLKRSCSEPASKPSSTPVVPRVRALSDSYDTTNKNLQVSSQIVTSLNGHRDIEIKFFSSSTPTSKV